MSKSRPNFRRILPANWAYPILATLLSIGSQSAVADDKPVTALKDRRIGYVLTDQHWAVYQTETGRAECPDGFNDGPREQFPVLFPNDGKKRTLLETQLARESEIWFPSERPESFPFKEVQGRISFGLDLDGKTKPNDFTSPEGEVGIDNQLYRSIGCVANYRGPTSLIYFFTTKFMQDRNSKRTVIEISDVDSLVNDDEVAVAIYRGRDSLLTDASGTSYVPGGSQRIDARFGKRYIQHFRGKIVSGVLSTDGADTYVPAVATGRTEGAQFIRGMRFNLKLTAERAEGLLVGYADLDAFYQQLQGWSTHHQSYGQLSSPSLYRALHRLADGYPDPVTGKNTAISSALSVKFTQVFVQHPAEEVASNSGTLRTGAAQ